MIKFNYKLAGGIGSLGGPRTSIKGINAPTIPSGQALVPFFYGEMK